MLRGRSLNGPLRTIPIANMSSGRWQSDTPTPELLGGYLKVTSDFKPLVMGVT